MWLTTVTYQKPFVLKMNSTDSVKSDQQTETQKTQPNGNLYTSKAPEDDESHQMISSLFLGPHAENYEYFKSNIIAILEYTRDARLNYFPEDGVSCPHGFLFISCNNTGTV